MLLSIIPNSSKKEKKVRRKDKKMKEEEMHLFRSRLA